MISKACAHLILPSKGIYTQSLEAGQDDICTCTCEGQLYSG